MIVQVALSVVLVAAAALFIRSFTALTNRPLGLEPDPVLVVTIDAQRAVPDPAARMPLYREAHDAVLGMPNVAAAGVSFLTPFGTGGFTPVVAVRPQPEGPIVTPAEEVFANLVSHGWFRTFGTPLVSGRDFSPRDRKGAPRAAIVNETFVRRVLSGRRPIGASLVVYPNTPREMQAEIVGVVADAVYSSPRTTVPPTWYLPLDQFDVPGFPFASARLSLRAHTGPPSLLTDDVEAVLQRLNPRLVLTFRTLNDQVRGSLSRERLMAQLAGFLGALALLLAGLGLYGVTSYAVSRRRVEIGIRVALGASPAAVVRLVLGRTARLVGVGIVAGVAASAWAAPLVEGLIYDVPARDPRSLAGAAAMLMLLAGVAAWLPARRAARIDPPTVIREG